MYRPPRAISLRQAHPLLRHRTAHVPRRHVSQLVHRSIGDPVRYQAVRFRKPGLFTLRRLQVVTLYASGIAMYMWLWSRYVNIEIEILDDEHAGEQESENPPVLFPSEQDQEPYYADEDNTFIPLTWATKMPRQFYRGSDPEWQEFIKLAKDKSRLKQIQNELVQVVFAGSLQHPAISRQLGKEPNVGKYWLDVTFPDGPPQEYERSGIEIGDGFVAWSQQKVSQEQQWRLVRTLWPRAALESLWATTKVLAGIQYRRMKQALGLDAKDPFSPEERWRTAMEMMQKQQHARERKGVGNTQTSPDGSPEASVASRDPAASQQQQQQQQPSKSHKDGNKLPLGLNVPLPPTNAATTTDIPIAMHVFSATLSRNWSPKKAEPPRGTFLVHGLIEVRGARGRMLFDVQGCYDPKSSKYTAVNAAVRNWKRWNQSPRGGP